MCYVYKSFHQALSVQKLFNDLRILHWKQGCGLHKREMVGFREGYRQSQNYLTKKALEIAISVDKHQHLLSLFSPGNGLARTTFRLCRSISESYVLIELIDTHSKWIERSPCVCLISLNQLSHLYQILHSIDYQKL